MTQIITFAEWQIEHYEDRLAAATTYKEKKFLTETLKGLKKLNNN